MNLNDFNKKSRAFYRLYSQSQQAFLHKNRYAMFQHSVRKKICDKDIYTLVYVLKYLRRVFRKTLDNWRRACHWWKENNQSLWYADTVLFATSVNDIKKIIWRLKSESDKYGIIIGASSWWIELAYSNLNTIQDIDFIIFFLESIISKDRSCLIPEIKQKPSSWPKISDLLTSGFWKDHGLGQKSILITFENNTSECLRVLFYPIFLVYPILNKDKMIHIRVMFPNAALIQAVFYISLIERRFGLTNKEKTAENRCVRNKCDVGSEYCRYHRSLDALIYSSFQSLK